MQNSNKTFIPPFIPCSDHPEEMILHVDMTTNKNPLICLKCFVTNKHKLENAESIVKLLNELQNFDKKQIETSVNPIPAVRKPFLELESLFSKW